MFNHEQTVAELHLFDHLSVTALITGTATCTPSSEVLTVYSTVYILPNFEFEIKTFLIHFYVVALLLCSLVSLALPKPNYCCSRFRIDRKVELFDSERIKMKRRMSSCLCSNKKMLSAYWLLLVTCSSLTQSALAVVKTRLTWVNGIAHTRQHMEEGKVDIIKLFGGKIVEYCYNPTSMTGDEDMRGYVADLTQAGTQKLGRITSEVNELVKHLREAISQVGKKGKVVHIAHSQGALVTYLAAKQLTPLEMSQIEVIAFGGAAAIRKTPQTPFARVVNYYSVNDPLLLVVPQAAQALRSGFVGEDSEFCFLAPRLGDPIRDHNLFGPTYAQALAWEGQRFQSQYQSVAYRSTRFLYLFLVALFRALNHRVYVLCKVLMEKTLLPVLPLFLYLWQKSEIVRQVAKVLLVKPIATVLLVLYLWARELYAMRSGKAEQFQPVNVAIEMAKDQS